MTKQEQFGDLLFCIRTKQSKDGRVTVWAHWAEVTESGALVFTDYDGTPVLSFSHGTWDTFFLASAIDGGAVAVEHWE